MSPFGRVVAAVSAVHLAVGIWVATALPGPLLSADDIAFLSLARTIAGEGAAPLPPQPPYALLYPLLRKHALNEVNLAEVGILLAISNFLFLAFTPSSAATFASGWYGSVCLIISPTLLPLPLCVQASCCR